MEHDEEWERKMSAKPSIVSGIQKALMLEKITESFKSNFNF